MRKLTIALLTLVLLGCGQQKGTRCVQLQDGTVLRGVTDFYCYQSGEATFAHEGRQYSTSTYTSWTEPPPAESEK